MIAAGFASPPDREPGGPPPLHASEPRPTLPARAGPTAVRLPPPWILIADDDPVIRDLWTAALRRAGFRTASARDGGEALDRMRMLLPDLMILDLRMPELSGDAVLQRVRQRPALSRIPVLIISGFLDEEPVADHGLNIVGRLPKPQSLTALVDAVRTALARRPPA
jgi:two-component system OmpR family response regulator